MSLHDHARIEQRLKTVGDPVGFLTNLFAHAPVGFAVWNADGRPLLTNKAFMDLFLVEPPPEYNVLKDELLAQNGMLVLFQRAFAGETVHVPTFWYDPRELTSITVAEGRRVAISMTIFPLFKHTGEIDYVAATYKDETEIMLANEQARLEEERLRLAQQAARIGSFEWNVETGVNHWTPELEAMYGLEPGEFGSTQQSWEALVHPDDRAAAAALVAEAFATGRPVEGEWRVVWRDETVHRLVGRFQVFTDDRGKQRLIGVNIDVTERRRAEQSRSEAEAAVRESEARKASVMEAALDAIVLMDHEGRITDFNEAAERTFGHRREEVLGKPLAEIMIPPALRDRHSSALRRYLETGEGTIVGKRIEVPAMRKDGTEFPAEIAVVRIRSEGAPVFTGYIRDIAERKQAAQAEILRHEKEAAQAANRELEAFSYSVAHDLRAPLRGISGFSGALLEDFGDRIPEEARALLGRITGGAERMGHLIDGLLALARVSRTELRRETVDLAAMARGIVEHLRSSDPGRSVDFVTGEAITATGDPRLLRAVLENLLGNAWKFTRDRSSAKIELGCETLAGAVRYHVRDNGTGFDMTYANRLFSPFQRLHSAERFEGTGIGLATVQRIVQRHGGEVSVEAEPDVGATFFFTLPRDPTTPEPAWIPAR